jgi:hypothetical protein
LTLRYLVTGAFLLAQTELAYQILKELKDVKAAISALLTNGQEHSITGSHSFKGVNYGQLVRRRNALENRLAALNNGKPTVEPDFS